jgi:hypothetical protein
MDWIIEFQDWLVVTASGLAVFSWIINTLI